MICVPRLVALIDIFMRSYPILTLNPLWRVETNPLSERIPGCPPISNYQPWY